MEWLDVEVHPQAMECMEQFVGTWKIVSSRGFLEAVAAYTGLPLSLLPKLIENRESRSRLRKRLRKASIDGKPGWEIIPMYIGDPVDEDSYKCILGSPYESTNLAKERIKVVCSHNGEHFLQKSTTSDGNQFLVIVRMEDRLLIEVTKYKEYVYTTVWEKVD